MPELVKKCETCKYRRLIDGEYLCYGVLPEGYSCAHWKAAERKHTEWISVKDRLPEPGKYVLCWAKRNPFSRFMPMVAKVAANGFINPATELYITEIKSWAEIDMPEPPKED